MIRKALIVTMLLVSGIAFSQELSNIGKKPPLAVNGGISLNQVFFHSGDTLSARETYAYTLMGNMNFSFYGWSVPLSVLYSNKQWSHQQPFNQFTLHPSYKWIRTHIGYSSMSFSPYTLSGHQFLGGGVELSPPGKWQYSAMGGRLQKRIIPDETGNITPAYLRYGSGVKTVYSGDMGTIGFNVFYAKDDANSLSSELDSTGILPMENLAIGLNTKFTIVKKLSVSIDYGTSSVTENLRAAESGEGENIFLLKRHESSFQYHAVKSNINYTSKIGAFGVGFERIDPGYKTLGAYYNNNDFINYTLNYSGGMLKNKVVLSTSFGLQYDDLMDQKDQKNSRRVGNLSLGFTPNEKLSTTLMYSNFMTYSNIKTGFEDINSTSPYGNLDTLDFTQIAENFTLTANYNLRATDNASHSVNAMASYQKATQQQSDNPAHAGSDFYTASGGYNMSHKNSGISAGLMCNYSKSIIDTMITDIVGPSVSLRKALFEKKMNTALMYSYNYTQVNKEKQAANSILRATAGYKNKQHSVSLNGVFAWRKRISNPTRVPDITVTLTYSYNFGLDVIKGKTKKKDMDYE